MRRSCFLSLLVIAACGGPADDVIADDAADAGPDGGAVVDADPDAPDADPGAPDARVGLQLGADCDVLADDECAAGLTCRLADQQGGGKCRTVGASAEGADCTVPFPFYADQPCGQAMICYSEPDATCQVLCDPSAPHVRCAPSQSCGEIADGVGVCY